jgi:hypothetical protein
VTHYSDGLQAGWPSSIFGRGKKFVQTGSGAHPASHPMGTGVPFHGGKAAWREDHSPPSNAEVMNGGAIPPLRVHLHGVMLN